MHLIRTLPPAAAPIFLQDVLSGLSAVHRGQRELDKLSAELKDYFAVQHCFLVSSGRAALTIILQALKERCPHKDRVLIPAYTCYSVPSAIVRAGLKLQLCDMQPDTLDFNCAQLAKLFQPLNPQLNKPNQPLHPFLAIIPAHLYGIPSDIDRLRSLLGDSDITIVEDAAQAMGGKWRNRKLGTLGDVGFFSLGRGKALSTVEGGIILTNRDDIAQQVSRLLGNTPGYTTLELFKLFIEALALNLFMHPTLFWLPKSLPFLKLGETVYDPDFKIRRMSSFQAGMAMNWKNKLRKLQQIRKKHSAAWSNQINKLQTSDLSLINHYASSDLIRFPIRVKKASLRKTILNQSDRKGLGIMPGYPDSIDGIPAFQGSFPDQGFPVARQYSQQLITFPIHSYVTKNDRIRISGFALKLVQDEMGIS